MKVIRIIFLLIFLCLFPFYLFSKSEGGHSADMGNIFPFDQRYFNVGKQNEAVLNFFNAVNAYLDKPNGENTGKPHFMYDPKFSRMTMANHRIWFHWGFGFKNARKFVPLVEIVNREIQKGNLLASDEEFFWLELKKETARRDKELINLTADLFGYDHIGSISSLQREQLNAFVTVAYSIHIIGDHTTVENYVIQNYYDVIDELYEAFEKLAGKSYNNRSKYQKLLTQLKPYEDRPERFLVGLQRYFSDFLLSLDGPMYDYKKKFTEKGYVLK